MSLREVSLAHYRRRQSISRALTAEGERLWRSIRGDSIIASWRLLLPRMVSALTLAQAAAAGAADSYLNSVLAEQSIDPTSAGTVAANMLSGVSSQGASLTSLLDQPRIATMTALSNGEPVGRALAVGQANLSMILGTQVADAGRVADQVAMTARKQAGGYVRMLAGASCSRCVILAGRWYRWSSGFQRHPRCDCVHIPSREDIAGDVRTDPKAYFASLSRVEQDRVFGKEGAESIRLGADMNQVVNARRGISTATVGGKQLLVTTEGTTKRGLFGGYETQPDGSLRKRSGGAPKLRLMPEEIIRNAQSRDEAINQLRRYGYLR